MEKTITTPFVPTSYDSFKNGNVRYVMTKDVINASPNHPFVRNCVFAYSKNGKVLEPETVQANLEANLCDAIARVAEINGMSSNDVQHIFPAVLRMLKSTSDWAK